MPLALWAAYVYVVFFSNGILPGPDATQLDAATWAEVRDLSLNFWLVAPVLGLPFSPAVHPMLEGIFNGLLAWAALFGGFATDGLRGERGVADGGTEAPTSVTSNAMLPVLVGMQFLTSAVLLPYLVVRPSPQVGAGGELSTDRLDALSAVGESRALPVLLGGVGTASVAWAALGRPEAFGAELGLRFESLLQLLSTDRVGSSFVVDLVIFALFQGKRRVSAVCHVHQPDRTTHFIVYKLDRSCEFISRSPRAGWLVDDDLRRRGVDPTAAPALRALGRNVPFFGLVGYMLQRPRLPARSHRAQR